MKIEILCLFVLATRSGKSEEGTDDLSAKITTSCEYKILIANAYREEQENNTLAENKKIRKEIDTGNTGEDEGEIHEDGHDENDENKQVTVHSQVEEQHSSNENPKVENSTSPANKAKD